jgi:arabinose-5-phosphate isomerase
VSTYSKPVTDPAIPDPPGPVDDPGLAAARSAIEHEVAAVAALSARLDGGFLAVVETVVTGSGRVVVTGLGKSGLIGRKIAATLASTGTPATFVHATEALHGDSGMMGRSDILLALSASGETSEVCAVAEMATRIGIPVIAMTGRPASTLGSQARYVLDVSVPREADPLDLAPTASTTAALAMGDALAAALMARRGFTAHDFARFHPGGSLGERLRTER